MATDIFTGSNAMARATALDQIHEGLTKAQALLCMTCGGGGESFRGMAPMYQDNFLWVVSDLVDSALEGFSRLMDEREAKVQQTKAQ